MKSSLLLAASIVLLSTAAVAADDDSGIKSYSYPKGKMQIPPPPIETLPGHAAPPVTLKTRPETVKTIADANTLTVGSASCESRNDKVQRFVNYLELKQGMENAPLTLHISNKGFNWFRLLIANQVVATEKSLHNGEANLDLTGTIQSGTNQVVVQAGGIPGSRLEWKVTSPSVAHIDKLDPNDEVLLGSELKIYGKGFSKAAAKDEVFFDKKKGQVTAAKENELSVKVPTDAETGDNKVSVKVNGLESNKVKIVVRGIPEISGTNLQGVPPGQSLIIFGKNFSKNTSENQVFFDDTPASVTSGDTTQLRVVVPFIPQRTVYCPSNIRVQVGKIMSENTVPVQIGPRMFTDPGLNAGGTDVPSFNPRDVVRSGY